MSRHRIAAFLMAVALATGLGVALQPTASASTTACAAAWSSTAVYTGGGTASYNSHNWLAKWWTQNDTPGGAVGVWSDQGACGGGSTPPPTTPPPVGSCSYPAWAAGTAYTAGAIVRYSNGLYYQATHDNPGYDPTISTWYWSPYTCTGASTGPTPPSTGGFPVSEAQFNQMFPSRNSFYTYSGLVAALSAYPAFAATGSTTVRAQEAAAFLANVSHETGGLVYVVEQNTSNYGSYCDTSQSYGCPAGTAAYYGRGPIQLSWNFNYKAAGDALGIDLLHNPNLVQTDASVAWKTGLWYWDTQTGPGTMTAHNAMVNGNGFGETIRSLNGSLECNGNNVAEMQDRVSKYQSYAAVLGVSPGSNLTC
jgi:predicted chitinase/chitodextrinase